MDIVPQVKTGMLEWVKTVNKNDIGYDESGRLIIRLPSREASHRAYAVAHDYKPLANKLLHPSDRVVHQSLIAWTRQLTSKFLYTLSLKRDKTQATKFAEIYNNAALILFSMGDIARARELCYSQIHLFVPHYTQYTYQPWINLSRIDRALGQCDHALKKLGALDQVDESDFSFDDQEILAAVKTCRLLEPIKVYLQTEQYQKILDQFEASDKTGSIESLLYESSIVALSRLNRPDEALQLINRATTNVSPIAMPVFMLRECELTLSMTLLNTLYDYALTQLKNPLNANPIFFAHHLAGIMQHHQSEYAIRLVYEAFAASNKLGDEVLKSESLIKLYLMMVDENDKKHLQKLIADLYSETLYANIKKRLVNTFPHLVRYKSIKTSAEIDVLYQELMLYATSNPF